MNKVYLVTATDYNDDYWSIEYVCKNVKTAERKKSELEKQKLDISTEYLTRYGNEYYQDLREIQCDELLLADEKAYDEMVSRVYLYQAMHSILSKKFEIQEREVI